MTVQPRRAQASWGPVVISLAAGSVVLLAGVFVNGCRIGKLLSSPRDEAGSAIIVVSPSIVRDSALAGATTMRVTNLAVTNGGTWNASTTNDWIHITPSSGGSRATVRLSLDPKGLEPGLHEGAVTLRERETDGGGGGGGGTSATVAVSFLIQQPVLDIEPGSLSFTARSSDAVFHDTLWITNAGSGPLVWTATTEHHASWLALGDTGGVGPGYIAVRASNAGLSYFGEFHETIIVTAPGAKNSPKAIDVKLRRRRHD